MLESIKKLRKKLGEDTAGDFVFTTYPEQHGFRAGATIENYEAIADEIEREVAERFMELPLDADGVPIRVGDVMDSRVDYLFDGKPFTVRALVLCEDGWEVGDGRFGNRYEPDSLRHHHEPTVEDVLREFASAYDRIGGEDDEHQKYLNLIAEFAAKLRLAGDAE